MVALQFKQGSCRAPVAQWDKTPCAGVVWLYKTYRTQTQQQTTLKALLFSRSISLLKKHDFFMNLLERHTAPRTRKETHCCPSPCQPRTKQYVHWSNVSAISTRPELANADTLLVATPTVGCDCRIPAVDRRRLEV